MFVSSIDQFPSMLKKRQENKFFNLIVGFSSYDEIRASFFAQVGHDLFK